jgi:hypothetical protein
MARGETGDDGGKPAGENERIGAGDGPVVTPSGFSRRLDGE